MKIGYHEAVVACIKAIKSCRYDAKVMNLFDVNDLDHGNYVYKYRVFRMTKMFAVLMSYELLTVMASYAT